jgi:hypothetical protein
MTAKEQIARQVLQVEGELNFALSVGAIRQAAVLRRQKTNLEGSLQRLEFWQQQEDEQRNC